MNRRELLKSLAPVACAPLLVKGKDVGRVLKIEPDSKYVVFVNPALIDLESFCLDNTAFPDGTTVHAVYGDDIDKAIRIFKL